MGGKLSIYDAISFDGAKRLALKLAQQGIDIPNCGMVLKVSFKGASECSDSKFIEPVKGGEIVLHYEPTNTDLDLIIRAQNRIYDLTDSLPGGRILAIRDNVRGDDPTSAHLHGGAIFGGAPDASVLSPLGEVWTAPDVFVGDASFMPGSGSTNSAHMTMANALRVAQFIAERL
ncbi:MAG: GMC oxidoreductase [Acidobacteriota bacterium]|nr:GMC oxidoreductase [Acidobacteriota bacterium]